MGIINFNGKASDELNVVVEYFPNYKVPQKQYKTVDIPGRNGSYLVDLGTYSNVERSYEIAIADKEFRNDFSTMVNPVVEWLCSAEGYCKLYDSYDQEYYRYAVYKGDTDIVNLLNLAGRCTLSFDCKPEKYLFTGDIMATAYPGTDKLIYNPTAFKSKPSIRIYGKGQCQVAINDAVITANIGSSEYVDIDVDTMNCYKGTTNLNRVVTFSDIPLMVTGQNRLHIISNATKLGVMPKWWTI